MSEDGLIVNYTGWDAFVRAVDELGSLEVRVGVVGEKAAEPHGDGRITNGQAMIFNEFGTRDGHVPARPVLRETTEHADMQAALVTAARRVMFEQTAPESALKDAGDYLVQQVRTAIAQGLEPGNAKSTIQQKGSDIPLIDHGQLVDAITAEVRRATPEALANEYEAMSIEESL